MFRTILRSNVKALLYFVLPALLLHSSCIKKGELNFKNIQVDNWQPDWALPVLKADLTLKNLLKTGSVLTEDGNGLYSLHYQGTLFSAKAADFIFIPDQDYSTPSIYLSIPQTIGSFSGTIADSSSGHFTFSDTSGSQLSHVTIKSGTVHVAITSTFKQNISVQIVFPYITSNGSALALNTTINYPNTIADITVNLGGYSIDLTNGNGSKNYIPYKIHFTLNGTGQPLNSGDNITARIGMNDIKYSFIDGFLGKFNIPIPSDTIAVGVFNNTLNANVYLRNPKINLTFSNSFGLAITSKFDHLFGLTNKGQEINMNIDPININGAGAVGQTTYTNYTIDSTNSTVQNMFNPAPNNVIYNGKIMINPSGSSTYNFVTDESAVTLIADAELPAWFSIIDFSLQDTMKLILPADTSLLQKAEFKMLMDNAFPLYGTVQIYFADSSYNVLDSLVPTTNNIISEAPVDANGNVTGRSSAITKFVMEHNKYNIMAPKTRYAFIRGNLKTSGTRDVKILSSNNLIVKLAFRFTLNISSGNL